MPGSINSATLNRINIGSDILAPASIFAGGSAVGMFTGINPATEYLKLGFGNPMSSLTALFLANPFQRINNTPGGRYQLTKLGMFGYKTLIGGIGPGGWARTLSPGALVLSTIQGTARGLERMGLLGTGSFSTALRHARTVGLAGITNPNASVVTIKGSAERIRKQLANYDEIIANDPKLVNHKALKNLDKKVRELGKSNKTALRHLAGMGETVHGAGLEDEVLRGAISIADGAKRKTVDVIVPRLNEKAVMRGVYTGTYKAGATMNNIRVAAARGALRMASVYSWYQLFSLFAKPVISASVSGASTVALSTLNILRNINTRDITPAQINATFMTNESATERQRAVQAIYGAKVNPANRFLGNEARMYHS